VDALTLIVTGIVFDGDASPEDVELTTMLPWCCPGTRSVGSTPTVIAAGVDPDVGFTCTQFTPDAVVTSVMKEISSAVLVTLIV
jgi:hypothetical protein